MPITNAEKSARYRAKDVEAYRAAKNALCKTEHHKAVRAEYMRKYRKANRESFNAMCNRSHAKHRRKHAEKTRNYSLLYLYGITYEQKVALLASQGGVCAICGKDQPGSRSGWHTDHCHTSGKVRGVLCNGCNTRLGWYEREKAGIETYLAEKG